MDIRQILDKVEGRLMISAQCEEKSYDFAFASDLMSDVLTLRNCNEKTILITGLCTVQTLRTANVADIHAVIVARNKKVNQEMIDLATEFNICLIESPYSIFRCCIALHESGLKPVY